MHYQYIIGIGSNLPSEGYTSPLETCLAALHRLQNNPLHSEHSQMLHIVNCSRWYRCPPVPISEQPWFVNAVFSCISALPPKQCLLWLHKIEQDFGRIRRTRNEARTLDLDIILQPTTPMKSAPESLKLQQYNSFQDLQNQLGDHQSISPLIPHPRMNDRHFVLYPLQDICPDFIHPTNKVHICDLIKKLDTTYDIYPIEEDQRSIGFAK